MLQIIDYSDKALAVVGDTRPVKDGLKNLGGRFNSSLSCGAGWVFPKSAERPLREFVERCDGAAPVAAAPAPKEYDRVYKAGGCTLGDTDMRRHRDVYYRNVFPCGSVCPHCGQFWGD